MNYIFWNVNVILSFLVVSSVHIEFQNETKICRVENI